MMMSCVPLVRRLLGSPRALAGAGVITSPSSSSRICHSLKMPFTEGKAGAWCSEPPVQFHHFLCTGKTFSPFILLLPKVSPRQPGAAGQETPHVLSLRGTLSSWLCLLLLPPPAPGFLWGECCCWHAQPLSHAHPSS